MDQVELLRRAAAGDGPAVRQMLDEAGPVVFGFVLARVGGDRSVADDIVQDTFVEAVRSSATFRGEAALATWLCTIARRRLARHYASERRREDVALAAGAAAVVPEARSSGEDVVVRRDEVVRALGQLPAVHRQVLVRKYLDGSSVAEIAAELGRTRVQVQSLLQRARDGLRSQLEATGA